MAASTPATRKPAKKAAAKKVAAPPRARNRTATAPAERTVAPPAAEVEDQAVAKAAAPARKAARKRAPSKAAAAAAAMRGDAPPADEPAGEEGDKPFTVPLEFKGRTMLVKLPEAEQLAIYRRLSLQFQDLATRGKEIDLDEALKHLDRAVRLIQSVLVSDRDREWIEEGLMDGVITLAECNDLLMTAFQRMRERVDAEAAANGNREQRRRAARLAD